MYEKFIYCYTQCCYIDCLTPKVVMLIVIMQNEVMLCGIMPNVIKLGVMQNVFMQIVIMQM
jgi:hypothetical protein